MLSSKPQNSRNNKINGNPEGIKAHIFWAQQSWNEKDMK